MDASPLAHALSSVAIGPDIRHGNLVMLPLVRGSGVRESVRSAFQPAPPPPIHYAVLDDALALGEMEITEVSAQGSVSELRVVNRGSTPVLIVDGEELVGAKQNRVVNLTILVAANSSLTVPVSCVEAGRWSARSREFASAPRTQYASGRAKRMAQVTASVRADRGHRSDQSAVWAHIAEMSAKLQVGSPTGAMEAIFVDRAPDIDAAVRALPPVEGQAGALFAVDGRIVGFDLFDDETTLRKLLPKLVRGVAVDALDRNTTTESGDADKRRMPDVRGAAALFLSAVSDSTVHTAPAVGLGQDLRLTGSGLTGAALVVDGRAVHVSAFAH